MSMRIRRAIPPPSSLMPKSKTAADEPAGPFHVAHIPNVICPPNDEIRAWQVEIVPVVEGDLRAVAAKRDLSARNDALRAIDKCLPPRRRTGGIAVKAVLVHQVGPNA